MTAAPQGNYAKLIRGLPSRVQDVPIIPGSNSPGVMVTDIFTFQSYFDSTLLERAILPQLTNDPIVASTKKRVGIGGYALGLHPSSQTPVAIVLEVGGSAAGQQAIILKPGQIYRPHGKPTEKAGHFSAFTWGLPFGWLGGGHANLYVFPSPDADVAWPGNAEVIFHRVRMQILAPAALPVAAPKNWPMRFPWTQALQGTNSVQQYGKPVIAITEPSRVIMSLRLASLATADTMRILYHEDNDFDLDSAGAVIAGNTRFIDTVWGTYAAHGGANLAPNYPLMQLESAAARIAADDGGVSLVDLSAGTLTNAYVDVVRYGYL